MRSLYRNPCNNLTAPWYEDMNASVCDSDEHTSIQCEINDAIQHLSTVRTLSVCDTSNRSNQDILILDSGGGQLPTITRRAWYIQAIHAEQSAITGYQSQSGPLLCPIVNGITKAKINNRDQPVLLIMNYATLIDDTNEMESLCVPFAMIRHGVKIDLTPTMFGGTGGIDVDDETLPFEFDGEVIFQYVQAD